MYQKVDFLALLQERRNRQEVADELNKQAEAERQLVEQKYKCLLDEYRSASDILNKQVADFNSEWTPLLEDYRKEMKSIDRKFKAMFKAL